MPEPVFQPEADTFLSRLRAGDAALFAEIAGSYRPALTRFAMSRLPSPDWAEEAVQETLLAAFRFRQSYNPQYSFRTWLWSILLNECHRIREREARRPDAARLANYRHSPDAEEPCLQPWQQASHKEDAALIARLLPLLPEPQADALRLRFFAELTFPEIAAAVGCSVLTAKNRVKQGLLRLSGLLPEDYRRRHAGPGPLFSGPVEPAP